MNGRFSNFLDAKQERGRYVFTKDEIQQHLQISEQALSRAFHRFVEKKRLLRIRSGFYVIVPLEYRSVGTLPAPWFIDSLMKHLDRPYYVGCLTAAAHYGAAHQKPQEFQVISDEVIPTINARGLRISFFMKSSMALSTINKIKTPTGFMRVSDPATTALDLLRFEKRLGGLNRVAEVLDELADELDAEQLLAAAQKETKITYVQRLGYLLDKLGKKKLTNKIAAWIKEQQARSTPLKPRAAYNAKSKDSRWNVFVNLAIEVEQ